MLVKFADTQQTADLVEQCRNASGELSNVVDKLENCIHDFAGTNEIITNSAKSTLEDCNYDAVSAELAEIYDRLAQGREAFARIYDMNVNAVSEVSALNLEIKF